MIWRLYRAVSLCDLVLKINHYNAAQLISHAERIKEAYIDHCQLNATHFGKSSKLLRESDEQIDRHSIVPLVRTDWSEKLDDADSARKAQARGDTDSWSTISRPVTLTGSEVSELFNGGAERLAPQVMQQTETGGDRSGYGGTIPTVQIEGMELPPTRSPEYRKTKTDSFENNTDTTTSGAIKPGDAYQVHPRG